MSKQKDFIKPSEISEMLKQRISEFNVQSQVQQENAADDCRDTMCCAAPEVPRKPGLVFGAFWCNNVHF